MKLSRRIFAGITFTTLVTVVLTSVLIISVMYKIMSEETQEQVRTEALYISSLGDASYSAIDKAGGAGNNRLTLIAPDGTVKYDNSGKNENMENHSERPEFKAALSGGTGEDMRMSATFGKQTYYYAVRLSSGDVLRVACETSSVFGVVANALPGILSAIIVLLALAMTVAGVLTRSIVSPINKLNIDEPLSTQTYDELSPLLVKIDKQNKAMLEHISMIYENRRENEYITENMHDGLVIIDSRANVISANKAAESIFGFELSSEPQSYLEICRGHGYRSVIESALGGCAADTSIEREGRVYSISASPVSRNFKTYKMDNDVYAVVVFVHDITEREKAERLRREFSANVSHELKTPLTSIMGCSEIMKEGIAKPDDVPMFLNRINSEAKRLLALIDDIIRISGLDENKNGIEMTELSLGESAGEVCTELKDKAAERGIIIEKSLKNVTINGNKSLIHEMIYNLVDNSIRYNKDGGEVKVTVGETDGTAFISVKDSGIGISEADCGRVFERFYRVDKSHSRETGGTGLGLSIVKHAALIHGGKISIASELGKGTEIRVDF